MLEQPSPAWIISRKRDGEELTDAEIRYLVNGFVDGTVADYQMSAWAMAVCLRGMTSAETASLTRSMLESGQVLPRRGGRLRVDKHSTGGLGDKTSLILAPLLACGDLSIPMISGRGLGTTGGTLDKLDSIPGFRSELPEEEFCRIVDEVGCAIAGATPQLAPADKRLYALRDVTGTVPSIPLITASIMSKKLAENLDSLVLDVKWGSGAFMKTRADARRLASSLVETGRRMNVATTALLTDMNQPLGRMVGNAVEVDEAARRGPQGPGGSHARTGQRIAAFDLPRRRSRRCPTTAPLVAGLRTGPRTIRADGGGARWQSRGAPPACALPVVVQHPVRIRAGGGWRAFRAGHHRTGGRAENDVRFDRLFRRPGDVGPDRGTGRDGAAAHARLLSRRPDSASLAPPDGRLRDRRGAGGVT